MINEIEWKTSSNLVEYDFAVSEMKKLVKEGKMNLFTGFQLKAINGSDKIESIDIENDDKASKNIKTEQKFFNVFSLADANMIVVPCSLFIVISFFLNFCSIM